MKDISPALVQGRYVIDSSARNPWKLRSWIHKEYGTEFDRSKLLNGHLADPVDFSDRRNTVRRLKLAGIPNPNSYTTRFAGDFIIVSTHADGKDLNMLQKLKTRLNGVTSFDKLSKFFTYEIHAVFPVRDGHGKTFKCAMEQVAAVYHLYAHVRKNERESTIPFFYSGLHPGLGGYVSVMLQPPKMTQISRGDVGAIEIFNRLVRNRAYPLTSNAIRVHGDRYLITDPWKIREIPRGIFSSFTRSKIVSQKGFGDSWIASGGSAWAKEIGSLFMFEKLNFGSKSESPTTLSNTMNNVLKSAIKRYEIGPTTRKPIGEDVRSAISHIRTSSKHIGSGSYGDVYAISLDQKKRKWMDTLLSNLRNVTSFESIGKKSRIVMKIEELDRMIPLNKDEVFRLAGEAYIQQYVHTQAGKCAPAVFFSGTLANKYHIIVMQYARGETLDSFIQRRKFIPPRLYKRIDMAVSNMLRSGVVHSDLHSNNILVDPATYSVKLIDFGFATMIPPDLHNNVLKILNARGSVRDAFEKTGLMDVINSSKFQYSYYFSDPKLISRIGKLRNLAPTAGLRSHALKNARKTPKTVVRTYSRAPSNTTNE